MKNQSTKVHMVRSYEFGGALYSLCGRIYFTPTETTDNPAQVTCKKCLLLQTRCTVQGSPEIVSHGDSGHVLEDRPVCGGHPLEDSLDT